MSILHEKSIVLSPQRQDRGVSRFAIVPDMYSRRAMYTHQIPKKKFSIFFKIFIIFEFLREIMIKIIKIIKEFYKFNC